jgi:hypothetical protein
MITFQGNARALRSAALARATPIPGDPRTEARRRRGAIKKSPGRET